MTHEKPSSLAHGISGIMGGCVATAITHPLDLVKTRFQVQDHNHNHQAQARPFYRSTWHAFTSIFKAEGFSGLYRGLTPNLLGSGSSWGLYFVAYNFFKSKIGDNVSVTGHLLAATEAGIMTSLVTNPIWLIKTRMQLQTKNTKNYKNTWDAVITIFREEGVLGYYKGLVPALFGVSHGAIQFMAYDELKKILSKHHGDKDIHQLSSWEVLAVGSSSKIIAAVATYPYQERPVDNRAKYAGPWDVVKYLWRMEGFRGYYKGLVPNVLRVTPQAAITFVIYEKMIALTRNRL